MRRATNVLFCVFMLVFAAAQAAAQEGDLRLKDWRPKSQLVVRETKVLRPMFPVIDFHNHLGRALREGPDAINNMLAVMDSAGVVKCVSLDARSKDDNYREHIKVFHAVSRDRFIIFFVPDLERIDEPDFGRTEAAKLEAAVKMGCRGMKIYKNLGLTLRDKSGKIVPVDDPRLDPIWAKCGDLGIPVMIHVSDPKAFFTPVDRFNERYDELGNHPGNEWMNTVFLDGHVQGVRPAEGSLFMNHLRE